MFRQQRDITSMPIFPYPTPNTFHRKDDALRYAAHRCKDRHLDDALRDAAH